MYSHEDLFYTSYRVCNHRNNYPGSFSNTVLGKKSLIYTAITIGGQTYTQTDKHTDIATYRLYRPRSRLSEHRYLIKNIFNDLNPKPVLNLLKFYHCEWDLFPIFIIFKESALCQFFHRVAMSVYVCGVPFSCNLFQGLSLALRSHEGKNYFWWKIRKSFFLPYKWYGKANFLCVKKRQVLASPRIWNWPKWKTKYV